MEQKKRLYITVSTLVSARMVEIEREEPPVDDDYYYKKSDIGKKWSNSCSIGFDTEEEAWEYVQRVYARKSSEELMRLDVKPTDHMDDLQPYVAEYDKGVRVRQLEVGLLEVKHFSYSRMMDTHRLYKLYMKLSEYGELVQVRGRGDDLLVWGFDSGLDKFGDLATRHGLEVVR
jgi:hypothetical protein